MTTFIEKGQVFENLKYFLVIEAIENDSVCYKFYNKHEFYFEPSKKKRQTFDLSKLSSIEVVQILPEFLKKIEKESIQIAHQHFNKQPSIGVKTK